MCVTVTLVDGLVLALPLLEVSAKVRNGPPVDDYEDYALPHWAGVLPLETRMADPVVDGGVPAQAPQPHWAEFTRFAAPKP